MKIEIGESLILSWLRHVKECKIVQTNWKASSRWELRHSETLDVLRIESAKLFDSMEYDIYKGNANLNQILSQAEIDAIGIAFEDSNYHIYAVDVAFHEAGLNYGSRNQTVARIIKKCLRTAMCIYGYYGLSTGTIIFASPKINPAVIDDINKIVQTMTEILSKFGLNYNIRIIANDDFNDKMLEPLLNILDDVADTSELFMRSLQMYNLFASNKPKKIQDAKASRKASNKLEQIEYSGLDGLQEMKIGVIVRTVLVRMLENGEIGESEIELMQTKEYSKETFDIQYPLLLRADSAYSKSPARYYSNPVKIYEEYYFVCSEWFEVPANNDRPYLMKWLALRK